MSSFDILNAGVLSLLQDNGRFGQSALGLSTSGAMDAPSAAWANRLLNNHPNATLIECSVGGLKLKANGNSYIAVTGAQQKLSINGEAASLWCSHKVKAGDIIELGMSNKGLRSYLAVAGGFLVSAQFGSTSTTLREGIGGLNGLALQTGDTLNVNDVSHLVRKSLPQNLWPQFNKVITLRIIEGYQAEYFSKKEREQFYLNTYIVSNQADRMGYKLIGEAIHCERSTLLSEGICYGAVQIPPDGQPIVLLNDRQTLGGYPKLGSVLSLDCALLAQAVSGTHIHFTPISTQQARDALNLFNIRTQAITNQLVSL